MARIQLPEHPSHSGRLNSSIRPLCRCNDPRWRGSRAPLANSRARLRMSTLYYHGQANGLLVAGTGNKVEDFGVGFYTKYGDGG